MKEERRKQMGALLAQRKTMTMEELRDHFRVSMNTIRSDVAYLAETGALVKIYGGVRVANHKEVPLFAGRATVHTLDKRGIAAAAEALIEDQDIIFIDAGTTTMHLIDRLSPNKRVTVVTANLYVIQKAVEMENVTLIVLPGTFNRRTNSLADTGTLEFLSRYQFGKAFMGVSGVSEEGKLNVSTYLEYEIKRTVVKQSRSRFLLVDSSKFGSTGLMSYGTLSDMTSVITDENCPEYAKDICGVSGVALIEVKPG